MEPAGRVVSNMKPGARGLDDEGLAVAAWTRAAGKKIAARTRAIGLVRDRLIVEVEDPVWKSQLFSIQKHILENIEKELGRKLVAQLEFRVAIQRREAASVEHHDHRGLPKQTDEADLIVNPVLRGIYVASRKRANR